MSGNSDASRTTDKAAFVRGKHKRLSDAAQKNLSNLTENIEMHKSLHINLQKNIGHDIHDSIESVSRENNADTGKENENIHDENDGENEVNKDKNERIVDGVGKRKMPHGYEPECESLFEEQMNTAEERAANDLDQVNKTSGSKFSVKWENSINQTSSIRLPVLNLSSLCSETDSSDISDMNQTDEKQNKSEGDSPKNLSDLTFFPELEHTCKHGNINYRLRKRETEGQKLDKIPRKCILCDIKGASIRTKAVQTDSEKVLSELIYPYEYYDRYSRADKKQPEESKRDLIPICQPVKVIQKPPSPQRITQLAPVPAITPPDSTKTESPREAQKLPKSILTAEVEDEGQPKEKKEKHVHYLYEPKESPRTEFHGQCGNTTNTLVITEHEDQKKTPRGMKGYFQQQKDGKFSQRAVKQSEYTISSLGIHFTIPEYNTSLHRRKEPAPRLPTQQISYTPRFNEQYLPLSQPPAFRPSPKQAMLTNTPRDLYTPFQQPLAPVPSVEDVAKSFDTQRSQSISPFNVKTSGETTSSSRNEKIVKFSKEDLRRGSQTILPSIPQGMKQGYKRSALISGPITVGGFTL